VLAFVNTLQANAVVERLETFVAQLKKHLALAKTDLASSYPFRPACYSFEVLHRVTINLVTSSLRCGDDAV